MKKILIYVLLIGVFASLTWYVIEKGNLIVRQTQVISNGQVVTLGDNAKPVVIDPTANVINQFLTNIKYPLSILLLPLLST